MSQKLTWVRDEARKQYTANFNAKLLSVSSDVTGKNPVSGKERRSGVVEFTNPDGEVMQAPCIIHEANYAKGMKVGNSFLCEAIKSDDRDTVLITCSHLVGAAPISAAAFGFVIPAQVESPAATQLQKELVK